VLSEFEFALFTEGSSEDGSEYSVLLKGGGMS